MKRLIEWFRSLLSPSFTGAHNEPLDVPERMSAEAVETLPDTVSDIRMNAYLNWALPIAGVEDRSLSFGAPSRYSGPSVNFRWEEVACRDKGRTLPTGDEMENAKGAAHLMEEIRAFLGNKPISVNSWYRTPAYNKQVGGAKNSAHMQGRAVDFTVQGMTPRQVQAALRKAIAAGYLNIGGLGCYARFTHVDTGKRREWQG